MEDGEARLWRETGRGDGPPPPSRGQEGGGSDADVGSAVADECWQGVQQLGGAVAAAAPAGGNPGAKAPATGPPRKTRYAHRQTLLPLKPLFSLLSVLCVRSAHLIPKL